LATPSHPIPLLVPEAQPVEQVVADRFDLSLEQARGIVASRTVRLLSEHPIKDPDLRSYPKGERGPERELYVFVHGLDKAPRRVYLFHRFLLHKWLRTLAPKMPTPELMDHIDGQLGTWTLAQVVADHVGFASEEEIQAAFERGWVFGASGATILSEGETLPPGRIAIVERRMIPLVDGFLRFVYAENPGAAWSFMAEASAAFRFWFFSVVSSFAILLLFFLGLFQAPAQSLTIYAYSLILGGAIGNLMDRLNTNFVIDFIDMYWRTHHWPTYNIADMGISVGVTLLILEQLFFAPTDVGGVE
jgi:signal peptidase II